LIGNVVYLFRVSFSFLKFIFDPKLLSKTFHQIWKKLGDGVTPNEEANSVLLVEMGYIRLRKLVSLFVQLIEISEEMTMCYIKMLKIYVNFMKNVSIKHLCNAINLTK